MCADVNNGNQVERKLKLKSTHELLSYSLSTNVLGFEEDIFKCREGDTNEDIKKIVKDFVAKLT